MRRLMNAILFLALGLGLITAVVAAQSEPDGDEEGLIIVPAPELLIKGEFVPVEMHETTMEEVRQMLMQIPASDSCTLAANLTLPGGATADVTSNQTDITDPSLVSCTYGVPADTRGFRTAWYQFTSPISGRVTLETRGSSYDTILAVFADDGMGCGSLRELACNDDHQGFTSQVTLTIKRNVTYYVEVADYNAGSSTGATLNLAILFETIARWEIVDSLPPGGLSRHASVVDGNNVYILGGQFINNGTPIVSRNSYRYNTATGSWTTLAQKPGDGYSNTTAALLGGRIYMPSGFNGNQTTFDGRHWVYDIANNSWTEAASIGDQVGWPNGNPLAWAQAVPSGSDNRYFFTGGVGSQPAISANAEVSDHVYEYSPTTNSWTERAQRMLSPRFAHTAAWVTNRVCVAGGLSANDSGAILLGSAECWNPLLGDWFVIPDLNYPRYGAASAVGPDRKWYVFGGVDATGAVPPSEVYDPFTNSWSELSVQLELGGGNSFPTPSFGTGAFIDNKLWSFGGESFPDGDALPLVANVELRTGGTFLPVLMKNFISANDTLAGAYPININQRRPATFSGADDRLDIFTFNLAAADTMTVEVTDVPSSRDYDVSIYDETKLLWATDDSLPGNDARVTQALPAGTYFIVVERKEPTAPNPEREYFVRYFRTP